MATNKPGTHRVSLLSTKTATCDGSESSHIKRIEFIIFDKFIEPILNVDLTGYLLSITATAVHCLSGL